MMSGVTPNIQELKIAITQYLIESDGTEKLTVQKNLLLAAEKESARPAPPSEAAVSAATTAVRESADTAIESAFGND